MFSLKNYAQEFNSNDSIFEKYNLEQDTLSQSFSKHFYGDYVNIYSLDEPEFINVIDSLKKPFIVLLARFQKENPDFDQSVIYNESKDIQYFFDKLILDYPYFHERYTGEKKIISPRLDGNLKDFNDPELVNIDSYVEYLKAFLHFQSKIELEKDDYKKLDNQQLNATFNLIDRNFSNQEVVDFLKSHYLYDHIDNFGIKNTASLLRSS